VVPKMTITHTASGLEAFFAVRSKRCRRRNIIARSVSKTFESQLSEFLPVSPHLAASGRIFRAGGKMK
jgi:hypothetical protein